MTPIKRSIIAESNDWLSLWSSTTLMLLKGIVGWISGSQALLADALSSAAAAGGSLSKQSVKKKEQAFMFRSPLMINSLLTIIFTVIGLEVVFASIRDIIQGIAKAPHWSALLAIAVGFAINEWLSPEKEHRLFVPMTAMIGVGSALLGDTFSIPFLYYMDAAASIIVVSVVTIESFQLTIAAVKQSGKQGQQEVEADELMQVIQRVNGVIAVKSLRAKEQGHYITAEIIVSVNPRITMAEGNEIAKRVKQRILDHFIHVTDTAVYVEPYHPAYPYKSNHEPDQEYASTLLQ